MIKNRRRGAFITNIAGAELSFLLLTLITPNISARDWPQWGGSGSRNMVAEENGLPDAFVPGDFI